MYCKFKTSVMISIGFIVNIFIKHLNFFLTSYFDQVSLKLIILIKSRFKTVLNLKL
jgi:hypothetical protein